jgi:hypothetical protein
MGEVHPRDSKMKDGCGEHEDAWDHEAGDDHSGLIRVSTADQLADLFTKSLQPRLHAASQASPTSRGPRLVKDVGTHEGHRDWIYPTRANRATSTLTVALRGMCCSDQRLE